MPTLYIFSNHDIETPIESIDALRRALPTKPYLPSAYCLDWSDKSIQIWYGNPYYHTVKYISHYGVEKQVFPTATDAYLKLAEAALTN